jgi:hypothetical protein
MDTGTAIYTARFRKIIYKLAKGIKLEADEQKLADKIIAERESV